MLIIYNAYIIYKMCSVNSRELQILLHKIIPNNQGDQDALLLVSLFVSLIIPREYLNNCTSQ